MGALRDLTGKVAWITGAGTGIGQAGALSLSRAGMQVILSGRRADKLAETAEMIRDVGGKPVIEALDIVDADQVASVAGRISETFGRLDVAVFSAGMNIRERAWDKVGPEGWTSVVEADLNGAFYCCHSVLPMMRKQQQGLIINVASWAGVRPSKLSGPAYSAAKHGMVAMNESLNMEEAKNGIRATALCPGEVATPILENRPVKLSEAEKAAMLQSEDLGETILFLAQLDPRVCVNQMIISPTANRAYLAS
tara:strand:- start:4786 stop:5541 length:756 start_codon:yes stop_codon:yes gene_type:complete